MLHETGATRQKRHCAPLCTLTVTSARGPALAAPAVGVFCHPLFVTRRATKPFVPRSPPSLGRMAVGALHGILVLVAAHTHALPPQRSIAAMRRPAALAASTSSPFMKQSAAAALRGGSAADGAARPENTAGETALTTLLLALWYASSIVNNQSSKVLVSLLGAEVLTLNQLLVSAGCGTLVLRQSPLRFDSRPHLILTAMLAASFLAGCYTLNSCLAAMHVSLAMVLRSAEPLTTLALGAVLLPAKEQPPRRKALALLPVVLGCGLSAVGPHAPSASALLLVAISNVCFSLRAILGRRLGLGLGLGLG